MKKYDPFWDYGKPGFLPALRDFWFDHWHYYGWEGRAMLIVYALQFLFISIYLALSF